MRTLSLVDCIELKFSGSVLKSAVCFGDCDNDGLSEFIVGNCDGDLVIYRDDKCICGANDLGTIAALAVGDLLNISKNVLVVVTVEGWCHVFDVESELSSLERTGLDEVDGPTQFLIPEHLIIWPFHSQRLPPNTKSLLLGDVNGDGLVEMVIGLTDRVVRTYQWKLDSNFEVDEKQNSGNSRDHDGRPEGNDAYDGRLFAMNKWEFANQVGSIALHQSDGLVSILVGQPGGTVTQITEKPVSMADKLPVRQRTTSSGLGSSSTSTNHSSAGVTTVFAAEVLGSHERHNPDERKSSSPIEHIQIEHYTLDVNHLHNQNMSSEVAGNISDGVSDDCYAVATLDGTIIMARENEIQWSIQVDRQILSLFEVNGKILACSWDGDTYLIERKVPTRFHFEDGVAAFIPGSYAIREEGRLGGPDELVNKLCMAFVTFKEKVYIYPIDLLSSSDRAN